MSAGGATGPAAGVPGPAGGLPAGVRVVELMELAERVARQAGALVRDQRPARVRVAATKSSPTDVVTEMDTAAEALLRTRLSEARPDDGLHGEEQGRQPGTSGVTWLIDPIDGTVNYLYGIPAYAVSVAAVVGDSSVPGAWRPIAGCVHGPATGETWTAGSGLGAWLDGERLAAQEPPELAHALIGTGFGYQPRRRARQARVVADLLPRVRDIRRIGCSAIDVCMVASGRQDAFFERGLNPWDIAASTLVATEAGVSVRGIDGRPPGDHMVVVARGPLADVLVGELERLEAGGDEQIEGRDTRD
ncbi:MAG TPA: inositol monophosphatase family protein [Kineosporiaceae bacterium]